MVPHLNALPGGIVTTQARQQKRVWGSGFGGLFYFIFLRGGGLELGGLGGVWGGGFGGLGVLGF